MYRGTPLPRTPSVSFREPLTDCQQLSEPEEESPSVTPRQAARQPRRKTQSSRFAADRGISQCPAKPYAFCTHSSQSKMEQTCSLCIFTGLA